MAHQYKLGKTTLNDLRELYAAAQEFAGNVDAAQSALTSEIEEHRDNLGNASDSYINSDRGQQVEDWLNLLEEFVDTLNSLGETLGDLDSALPEKPEA